MSSRSRTGVREWKRAATRVRVEKVAVDLCLCHGYDRITVERICAVAEVSTSTFFNYFGSKDVAILGSSPRPSDDAVAAFGARDGPLLADLIELFLDSARHAVGDLELFRGRMRLIDATPQLRERYAARVDRADSGLLEAIGTRVRRPSRIVSADPDAEAAMALTLAMSILRHMLATVDDDVDWDTLSRRGIALADGVFLEERRAVRRSRTGVTAGSAPAVPSRQSRDR